MTALSKLLTAGVGVAALVGAAAPAAAQVYPGYGYGYGGGGDVLSTIINTVLGRGIYGSYGQGYGYGYNQNNERYLVEQCARATQSRIMRNYGYAGYNQYGYNGYGAGQAGIVNITRVERRYNGGLRIYGIASSGRGYNSGYGGYGGYNAYNTNAGADLAFNCTIDYRGRITDIDLNRNRYGYRGY